MHSLNALQKIKFISTELDDKEEKFRMRRQRLMDEENETSEMKALQKMPYSLVGREILLMQ